jgi:NhaP-type Na+/H+ or K+/H+ antiporter
MHKDTNIIDILITMLLAVLGGLARMLYFRDRKKIRLGYVLCELVIAGFAGIMIYFLCNGLNFNGQLTSVVAGMAGWIGPQALDAIAAAIKAKTGIDLKYAEDKDSKSDD